MGSDGGWVFVVDVTREVGEGGMDYNQWGMDIPHRFQS